MNFYAGVILDPDQPMDSMANELLAQVIQVVSEASTKSERNTFREAEFVAWHAGVML